MFCLQISLQTLCKWFASQTTQLASGQNHFPSGLLVMKTLSKCFASALQLAHEPFASMDYNVLSNCFFCKPVLFKAPQVPLFANPYYMRLCKRLCYHEFFSKCLIANTCKWFASLNFVSKLLKEAFESNIARCL